MAIADILSQFQSLKAQINAYYALINGAVDNDANLDGLNSPSKTAEFNLWMWMFAAMTVIADGMWADRQQAISDKIDSGVQGTDPWLYKQVLAFQDGDDLVWDDTFGRYYYAVVDATKQIIKRCAIVSSGGITAIKVATEDGNGNPIALTSDQLSRLAAYAQKIQWSGARILPPTSYNSDKLNAPMTVYYNGLIPLATIQSTVQTAFNAYLKSLPYNGEYSINKHGDFIENADTENIHEVDMGVVQARADIGTYVDAVRIYQPISGYLEKDSTIDWNTMITYVAE